MPPFQEVGPADLSNLLFEYVNPQDTEFQPKVSYIDVAQNKLLFL